MTMTSNSSDSAEFRLTPPEPPARRTHPVYADRGPKTRRQSGFLPGLDWRFRRGRWNSDGDQFWLFDHTLDDLEEDRRREALAIIKDARKSGIKPELSPYMLLILPERTRTEYAKLKDPV